MGERAMTRAELASHQRDRVIAKVTPVFAKRGYLATTVDDLLATGKIGVGNFYSLFDGKEDCFLACFDRVSVEAQERIESATEGVTDWDRRAYLGLAAMLEYFCADPSAARIVMVEAQCAGSEATARYNAILDRAVAWLSDGRQGHPEAAELPPSFEQASVSGLAFYLQQCLLAARRPSAAELISETSGLLLEPIIGSDRLGRLTHR
jgi:AcrR family transcriptional regulator